MQARRWVVPFIGTQSYNLAAYKVRSRCPIFRLPVTRIPYILIYGEMGSGEEYGRNNFAIPLRFPFGLWRA